MATVNNGIYKSFDSWSGYDIDTYRNFSVENPNFFIRY